MLQNLKNRNFWFMLLGDCAFVILAYFLAYYLRFDGDIPISHMINLKKTLIWIVPLKLLCFYYFNLYKGMWRYTSIYDLENIVKACIISSVMIVTILVISVRFIGYARSVFVIDLFLSFLFVSGYRVGIRLFFFRVNGRFGLSILRGRRADAKKVLIVGAGDAGEKLLREIVENPLLQYDVMGFVDDDPLKTNRTIHGVPVLGAIEDIVGISKQMGVDELIIAISSVTAKEMRQIVDSCEITGLPCKTVPGIGELIEGKVSVSAVRQVRYEDLLGRKQVKLNMEQIGGYLADRRILVTGGAGSIGSELCRQIALFMPKNLIIVDKNESGLYETGQGLMARHPTLKIDSFLGSIQNKALMHEVFKRFKPRVVFHAAAYKHVPLMEIHPWEAVFNNIVGTRVILDHCLENGVDRCVIVSTDKAVRPTNVMGASKRVGEILAQIYAQEHAARFMAVRFGNVVGSAGSVVPLFQKQIERGGPVTVTHSDIVRYFMTISEASRLILQAGAFGNGGEIFILKMGTPVRIGDMARDMIRLSGFRPDIDIEIKDIGLRPGEKLFEELITEGEGIHDTEHEEIMVLSGSNELDINRMNNHIKRLMKLAEVCDGNGIKEELKRLVPEYSPQL